MRSQRVTVLIGDIVRSRELPTRSRSQLRLQKLMDVLNDAFRDALVAPFTISLGDEFEAVLRNSDVVPDVIWTIENSFTDAPIRLGIAYGAISTAIIKSPLGMDGEAFHHARRAIASAREHDLLGGVFKGFGASEDRVLNGIARILHHHRNRLKPAQRKILALRRQGLSQVEIASRLRITQSAVSQASRSAGWQPYSEAEEAFRAAFALRARKGGAR